MGVLTTILSGCVIKWYNLKQLLLRQLHCKWPFSWSRLHLSSCSLTGSFEDIGVLTNILSGCVIKWYNLKQILSRQLHCKWPFSWSRNTPKVLPVTNSQKHSMKYLNWDFFCLFSNMLSLCTFCFFQVETGAILLSPRCYHFVCVVWLWSRKALSIIKKLASHWSKSHRLWECLRDSPKNVFSGWRVCVCSVVFRYHFLFLFTE